MRSYLSLILMWRSYKPTDLQSPNLRDMSLTGHTPGTQNESMSSRGLSVDGSDDAPMRFFNTVAPWLIEMGFTQGQNDPCMFTNDTTGVQADLHVDDGLVRGTQAAVDFSLHGFGGAVSVKAATIPVNEYLVGILWLCDK